MPFNRTINIYVGRKLASKSRDEIMRAISSKLMAVLLLRSFIFLTIPLRLLMTTLRTFFPPMVWSERFVGRGIWALKFLLVPD